MAIGRTVAILALALALPVPGFAIPPDGFAPPTAPAAAEPVLAPASGPLPAETSAAESSNGGAGIFGCSAPGSKQLLGAGGGALLGGLLGNRIAGSGSRTLGTAIGAAVGGAAGSWIGCKLQRGDQRRAERAANAAAESGRRQSWSNAEAGTSGTAEVVGGEGLAATRFGRGLTIAPDFVEVARLHSATATANIRSGPGSSYGVVGRLAGGEVTNVAATVKGQPWSLVTRDGAARGYVSSSLLRPAATATAASACRRVRQTVNVPGAPPTTEMLEACPAADGSWSFAKV